MTPTPDQESAGIQGAGQSARQADRATAGLIAIKRVRFEPDLFSAWM
jgi:hypothetical protein